MMETNFAMTSLLLLLTLTTCFCLLLIYSLNISQDPKEPPAIPQAVPYIGHLLGLIRHGTRYYSRVSSRYPLSIYTLQMPQGNTYVVNSLDLVNAAQRNRKALSFAPFVATFLKRLCLPSKAASGIVDRNLFAEDGPWGLFTDTHNAMHQALAPGPDLDELICLMLQRVSESLNSLLGDHEEVVIDLYKFIRETITLASTDAVYGPENPFQDPKVREGFCAVENNFALLFINFATSWVAPKAHRGREQIFDAFRTYFANRGHERGSSLAKSRYHAAEKNGTPLEDIARFELSGLFGMLINTVPCTFWVTLDVFSDLRLLQDIRNEISTAIVSSPGDPIRCISLGRMKETCALLPSVFQETLRTRSTGSSIRKVREDFLLADRYLLKKNSMLQMPFAIISENPDLWGESAREYNPRRFIRSSKSFEGRKQANIKPGIFRGFGGGTTLCPGRHFATTEITSVVAMLAVRFEILPVAVERWETPRQITNHGVTSVLPPEKDIKVKIIRRRGFESYEWRFDMNGLKAEFVAGNES